MNYFNLFSKQQQKANAAFLADQRAEQTIKKIKKLALPIDLKEQLIQKKVFDFWFSNQKLQAWTKAIDYQAGEKVEYAATGIDVNNKDVLVTCTNRNLILVEKQLFHADQVRKIKLEDVKSVSFKKSQVFYIDLTLVVGDQIFKINSINKTAGPILAKTIKKYSTQPTEETKSISNNNQEEQLQKLKDLMTAGILTEEEYLAKKEKVLHG